MVRKTILSNSFDVPNANLTGTEVDISEYGTFAYSGSPYAAGGVTSPVVVSGGTVSQHSDVGYTPASGLSMDRYSPGSDTTRIPAICDIEATYYGERVASGGLRGRGGIYSGRAYIEATTLMAGGVTCFMSMELYSGSLRFRIEEDSSEVLLEEHIVVIPSGMGDTLPMMLSLGAATVSGFLFGSRVFSYPRMDYLVAGNDSSYLEAMNLVGVSSNDLRLSYFGIFDTRANQSTKPPFWTGFNKTEQV